MPTRVLRTSPASAGPISRVGEGGLGLIDVPKSCDVLADQLQAKILDGTYPPGIGLPTERELVATTGLSRGSVREALRILESQGLVHTRAGRYGGSVVLQPSHAHLANHIDVFARGRGVPLSALVEARQALEPMVAYLAAKNRTEEDLETLTAISARLDEAADRDVPRFLQENADWHIALARAAHNDLLRAFTASISGLMLEASRIENFASPEVRKLVTIAHRRILHAIETRNPEAARRRAERDVAAYVLHLEAALDSGAAKPKAARARREPRPRVPAPARRRK